MPFVITSTEYLEISGIPLATPGWEITDLTPLLDAPDVRGTDRLIPGVDGVIPLPIRVTETSKTLQMMIYGTADGDGNPFSDTHLGVITNIAFLVDNIGLPPGGDGTRAAVLHIGGGIRTADVHVRGLRNAAAGPSAVRATLEIQIPSGYFIEAAS